MLLLRGYRDDFKGLVFFYRHKLKISSLKTIAGYFPFYCRLPDGIAKALFRMGIAVAVNITAIHKECLAVDADGKVAAFPFKFKFALPA